jgi:hypothetical protein
METTMSEDSKDSKHQTAKLQVQMDDATADGLYTNFAIIHHSETEFTLDFVLVQPQNRRARLRSRVLLHPKQAKRLAAALTQHVQLYESRFGEIEAGPPGPTDPGSFEIH